MFNLDQILRPHIKSMEPYSSARDEFKGTSGIFLDANENSMGSITSERFNRYPDPYQWELKKKISQIKNVKKEKIFLGNGSDEIIDLIFRLFCEPGKDNTIIMPPTYGMYEVSASINDVNIKKVALTDDYQIDLEAVLKAVDTHTKIIWICSPNNPTGNLLNLDHIQQIIASFSGIVVIDEAYIDFSPYKSLTSQLQKYPNLIIIQTFSKAWGLASLRLGMAFTSEEIIFYLNKIKPPYNINGLTQSKILDALEDESHKNRMVNNILYQKKLLVKDLEKLPIVLKIYPSDANFLLVKTTDGKKIYDYLVSKGIIVRDRSSVRLCEGCLRITIGSEKENFALINNLQEYPIGSNQVDL